MRSPCFIARLYLYFRGTLRWILTIPQMYLFTSPDFLSALEMNICCLECSEVECSPLSQLLKDCLDFKCSVRHNSLLISSLPVSQQGTLCLSLLQLRNVLCLTATEQSWPYFLDNAWENISTSCRSLEPHLSDCFSKFLRQKCSWWILIWRTLSGTGPPLRGRGWSCGQPAGTPAVCRIPHAGYWGGPVWCS